MRRSILIALPLLLCACASGPDIIRPSDMSELERVQLAGRSQIRAAYSGYSLTLFDLQLSFLETLPRAWFPDTQEIEDAAEEFKGITGHEASAGSMSSASGVVENARAWTQWYRANRDRIHDTRREQWDPLFIRLEATTPFLDSPEFRDMVRSVAELSGQAPGWGRGEQYNRWDDFVSDRHAWRVWFDNSVDRLEYDNSSGHLIIGRGLSSTHDDSNHTH